MAVCKTKGNTQNNITYMAKISSGTISTFRALLTLELFIRYLPSYITTYMKTEIGAANDDLGQFILMTEGRNL